jgi:hypothetical protein
MSENVALMISGAGSVFRLGWPMARVLLCGMYSPDFPLES